LLKEPLGKCSLGRSKSKFEDKAGSYGDSCDVDQLMEVNLNLYQFSQNLYPSCHCFASVFTSLQFQNICNVSDEEGDEPSGPIMGSFLNRLLWICQGSARLRNFVHRNDI
jgi:hypothetical protein